MAALCLVGVCLSIFKTFEGVVLNVFQPSRTTASVLTSSLRMPMICVAKESASPTSKSQHPHKLVDRTEVSLSDIAGEG